MILRGEGISKRYGDRGILQGVDFEIRPGELVGLLGASGSGKSTLARLLAALARLDQGAITLGAATLTPQTDLEDADATSWRRRVGFVEQQVTLWPGRSALRQMTEGLVHVRGMPRGQAEELAREWANRFELSEHLAKMPHMLSGGQIQRVGLARALVLNPEFLVLDEVTSGLDPQMTARLSEQLLQVRRDRSIGMLMITHQIEFIRSHSDRVLFLHEGRIVEAGPTESLIGSPTSPHLRAFLQSVRASW